MLMRDYGHGPLVTIPAVNAARRLFRHAAALALVAMLGLALAPTLSHALATQRVNAQPWSELCSVDDAGSAVATLAHCPLCTPAGQAPTLPGTPQAAELPAQDRAMVGGCAFAGAALAPVWDAPPSRAPPPVLA
jgi:hypothetical protein